MRLLGIDFGTKRIGLAVGDTEIRIATPLRTLANDTTLWQSLIEIVRGEEIREIVVGMPHSFKEKREAGEAERAVQQFIDELRARVPLPIKTEDERFSTHLAHRLLGSIKKDRDAVAAAVILQSYFDRTMNRES